MYNLLIINQLEIILNYFNYFLNKIDSLNYVSNGGRNKKK